MKIYRIETIKTRDNLFSIKYTRLLANPDILNGDGGLNIKQSYSFFGPYTYVIDGL